MPQAADRLGWRCRVVDQDARAFQVMTSCHTYNISSGLFDPMQ